MDDCWFWRFGFALVIVVGGVGWLIWFGLLDCLFYFCWVLPSVAVFCLVCVIVGFACSLCFMIPVVWG